jgi:hypothetical protein
MKDILCVETILPHQKGLPKYRRKGQYHTILGLLRRNEVAVCAKGHYFKSPKDHFYHSESPYYLERHLSTALSILKKLHQGNN